MADDGRDGSWLVFRGGEGVDQQRDVSCGVRRQQHLVPRKLARQDSMLRRTSAGSARVVGGDGQLSPFEPPVPR